MKKKETEKELRDLTKLVVIMYPLLYIIGVDINWLIFCFLMFVTIGIVHYFELKRICDDEE